MTVDYTKFSAEELRELYARLGYLLKLSATRDNAAEDTVDMLHERISEVLVKRGSRHVPIQVAKKRPSFKVVQGLATQVVGYVDRHFRPKDKLERLVALRLLVRLLVRRLEAAGAPISYDTIALNLEKVFDEVERQFPGYRASGLLPIVLSAKQYRADTEDPSTR